MNVPRLPSEPLEHALLTAIQRATGGTPSPALALAVHHAVFPGGARVRPRLCLAAARAASGREPSALAYAAAVAVELVHCATLVHDDLPCFDDAATRRGRPAVHAAYGEPRALLVGDGLLVLAFDVLAAAAADDDAAAPRAVKLVSALGRASGIAGGLVGGQALELEPPGTFPLEAYHGGKTAALFEAALTMGALAEGAEPGPYAALGVALGGLYQVADDLADAVGSAGRLGKPVGRDAALARPSAVEALGLRGALDAFAAQEDVARRLAAACPSAGPEGTSLVGTVETLLERLRASCGAPDAQASIRA